MTVNELINEKRAVSAAMALRALPLLRQQPRVLAQRLKASSTSDEAERLHKAELNQIKLRATAA